jgi:serine/threonine-protein kinase
MSVATPLDEELVLEPTEGPGEETPATRSAMGEASQSDEARGLLRRRLLECALAIAAIYLVLTVWTWSVSDEGTWFMPVGRLARMALALGVAGIVAYRPGLSVGALRGLELLLFLGVTLLLMGTQYLGDLELIRRGAAAALVTVEKNGVLQMVILMLMYGTLIPNDVVRSARVISAMALGPLILLGILLSGPIERAALMSDREEYLLVGSNAIYLTIGAVLAVACTQMLRGMRRELRAARELGAYRLGERLAEGGMGEVYLAEHRLLKRPCAVKLIKADIADNAVAVARFEREVQAAAGLSHPNSIRIFDYGHEADGTFYYVMELLPGLSSADLVRRFGPMPPGRAVYLMRQVCAALSEAHRAGLIHRDLKPANVFVAILGGQHDVAKVLDYGLVKQTAPGAAQLTADYTVSGTPSYMSPEQATADPGLDARADLYSLGAILYYWLTGRPPFAGENPTELMIAHARDPVEPPSRHRAGLPEDLEAVVLKCLAKRPSERYADARALADALSACGCAGTWGEAEAEAWWAARAAEALGEGTPATA